MNHVETEVYEVLKNENQKIVILISTKGMVLR